jgi:hypothetical protein
MAGWDYLLLDASGNDEAAKLARLAKLGEQSWELVAVDGGVLYFKRYQNYDQLKPNVAAQSNDQPKVVEDSSELGSGRKNIAAMSSTDSGPDGVEHSHRVSVAVGKDMVVISGGTDEVNGHTHPVTIVGAVDEAAGHTHTFSVFSGGDRSFQYDS